MSLSLVGLETGSGDEQEAGARFGIIIAGGGGDSNAWGQVGRLGPEAPQLVLG